MSSLDLARHGIRPDRPVRHNLSAAELVEWAVKRGEGHLADSGALVALTGERTARSPEAKYIVRDPSVESEIDWGKTNRPMAPEVFDRLLNQAKFFASKQDLFVHDGYACADPEHRLNIRVISELAWHAHFAQCLFRRLPPGEHAA